MAIECNRVREELGTSATGSESDRGLLGFECVERAPDDLQNRRIRCEQH